MSELPPEFKTPSDSELFNSVSAAGKPESVTDKKQRFLRDVPKGVKRDFGSYLTTLEGRDLREIVSRSLSEQGPNLTDLDILSRWFSKVYDVPIGELESHKRRTVKDETTGEVFYYKVNKSDYEAREKVRQLESIGHDATMGYGYTEEFREYVNRLRDEAHLL